MQIVLATDIFGVNNWTRAFVTMWKKQGYKAFAVTPYNHEFIFSGESEAYEKFNKEGGFEAYCSKLKRELAKSVRASPVLFIGFSAGGAALWKVLSEVEAHEKSHLIAYYPGQIRHHLVQQPNIVSSLIFPKLEQHFDLSQVIEYLVTKRNLNIVQNELLHGYANLYSEKYDKRASDELSKLLAQPDICLCPRRFSEALQSMTGEHKLITSTVKWQ